MKAQLVLPPLRDGAADRQVANLPIAAEIERVRLLSLAELRTAWRKMFSRSPPAALTRDLLARMIAWRMQEQEKAFGGHDPESLKLLARLARGERAGEPRRNLKSGTVLVREYRGVVKPRICRKREGWDDRPVGTFTSHSASVSLRMATSDEA